ncbi:MAG: zincin-like metallopeptidase domain-containing protein [Desulfuromonadales bacterium]
MGVNVYDVINSRIMELLEKGTVPWRRGWNISSSMPRSFATRKEYRGINVFLLASLQYSQPWFLTFNQIQERGGHVKPGEKACPIVFWKWIDGKNVADVADAHKAAGKIPLLRYYNVFNVEQTEGITYQELSDTTNQEFTPIQAAEQIISTMPDKPLIQHMGNKASYNPASDTITLPPQSAFVSAEEYYCTAFHELTHSTMAEHRLNRKSTIQVHQWGDEHYSKEELVAEMGASFLCGHAGIEHTTLENSAAYIQGWLKALKNDKTLLVHAAAAAQKASDYILNVTPTEDTHH